MKKNVQKNGVLLIVEDDIDLREVLIELLSPLAQITKFAGDGKEALQIVRAGDIDAVLTDVKMPIMGGLHLLAEIRSLYFQTPVIVATGHGDMTTIQEALRLGATDFIEKPFDHHYLSVAVTNALEFGVALRAMELEIEQLYSISQLPPDKLVRLKKIKRATLGMKLGFSSYVKKSS